MTLMRITQMVYVNISQNNCVDCIFNASSIFYRLVLLSHTGVYL